MLTGNPFLFDKRRVAEAFNRAAPTYAEHAIVQDTVARRLAERLDLFRIEPALILDLGTGRGNAVPPLARHYPRARIIAFDIAIEMLRLGSGGWRRRFSRHRYVCGDAECLPFTDASFDLVFSNMTLQWCPDLPAALAEIRRVLKPQGLVLFTTVGPDTLMELRESWAAVDSDAHVNAFLDMHDVGDALIRAGLSSPVMDVEYLKLTYPDVTAVMRELKAIGAHNVMAGRPLHLTAKGTLRRLIAEYERRRSEGVIPATWEIIYGHAWAPSPGTRPQDGSTVATFPISELRRPRRTP